MYNSHFPTKILEINDNYVYPCIIFCYWIFVRLKNVFALEVKGLKVLIFALGFGNRQA